LGETDPAYYAFARSDWEEVRQLLEKPAEEDTLLGRIKPKAETDGGGLLSVYDNLGQLEMRQLNYSGAIEFYNMALKRDPNRHLSHYNKGVAYLRLRDWSQASEAFMTVQRLAPTSTEAEDARRWIAELEKHMKVSTTQSKEPPESPNGAGQPETAGTGQ
jgi:tetratricopeptide (TPR) repeat protein